MRNVLKMMTLAICLLLTTTALALTLQEAKSQGLVGEQRDGYVGFVVSDVPVDVRALVRDINSRRRVLYQEIAEENGIRLEQVAALAYEEAVEETRSGHYVQNASGAWQKK